MTVASDVNSTVANDVLSAASNQNLTSRRPMKPLLRFNFDGSSSLEEFLSKFNAASTHFMWSEEDNFFQLHYCLSGRSFVDF